MANLTTAPPEIISQILLWVLPDDLENFAQCCKAVLQQADRKRSDNGSSLLQEHRILIQNYSTLTDLKEVEPFLRALAADQRIARYVRKMDLGPSQRTVHVNSWGTEEVFEDKEIHGVLISAAKTIQMDRLFAKYLSKSADWDPQRIKRTIRLVCANTDLAIALLLPLLPNLSVLSCHWRWPNSHYNWTNHWITNLANTSYPILKKLKEVNVRSMDRGCTMPEIVCLTALPSLQKLAVWRLESPPSPSYAPHLWSQRHSCPHNTVSNLKLWGCSMETWKLYDYLEPFKKLKSFCFLGDTPDKSIFDPMPLFATLLSHSETTLTKLSLRSYSGNTTPKPPFKQLEVLKELYVDWQMLIPQPYIVGDNWETLLPQSLEALTIHDHYEVDGLKDWNAQVILKRFEPVVEDLISCKKGGLSGIRDFSFTAEYGLQHMPEDTFGSYSVGIKEVELGFRYRCGPAGVCFSFKKAEA